MAAIATNKINSLFALIEKSSKTDAQKTKLYETVREILNIRRVLGITNDISALFNKHTELFDYFVEKYTPAVGKNHAENLDVLFDIYYGLGDENDDDDDETETDSDESGYESEDSDESTDDSDSDSDESDSDDSDSDDSDDEGGNNVKIVLDIESHSSNKNIDALHTALSKQHVKTRWLMGANLVVALGNLAITTMSVLLLKRTM